MIRHKDLDEILFNLIGQKIKQSEIAYALFLTENSTKKEKTLASVRIGKRSQRNSPYSLQELYKLNEYLQKKYGVNLLSQLNMEMDLPIIENKSETEAVPVTVEDIKTETQNKSITIQYWNDCDVNHEKIINPCFSELILDMQKVIHTYKKNPENLKFIAMPGDEMDGGIYPIKNNDLLVIDISINDTSSTGVYFCQNNSSIFVRRITELVGEGIYISVDNPLYSDILNGKMTYQELEDVGFKVIGKVIGNESIRL